MNFTKHNAEIQRISFRCTNRKYVLSPPKNGKAKGYFNKAVKLHKNWNITPETLKQQPEGGGREKMCETKGVPTHVK